jgi:poly(A) polymerase
METAPTPNGLLLVAAELDNLLLSEHSAALLEAFHAKGSLGMMLPEVEALIGFHQGFGGVHKDLWDHTLKVVESMPKRSELRWAALLHDVGKIPTRELLKNGKVTFWRHEKAGADIARDIGERLEWTHEKIEHDAYQERWTDKAIRRLIRDSGPYLNDLLTFSAGDITTKNARKERRAKREDASLRKRIAELLVDVPHLPSGLGKEIIATFQLEKGPKVRDAMAWLREKITQGNLCDDPTTSECMKALDEAQTEWR